VTNAEFQQPASVDDEILSALDALRNGNFAYRMPKNVAGPDHKVVRLFNDIMEMNVAMVRELERVHHQVSAQRTIPQKAIIPGAAGSWVTCLDAINALVDRLALPMPDALSRKQQQALQRTNEQLKAQAQKLSEQMKEVEYKNREIESARMALEQKAEQLVLSSRYKSEFLANMSHELRTPLNSLLILAQLLAENANGNLTPKQVEYAQTICISGKDLLALINDILDLSKIESGTVTLGVSNESLVELRDYVERAFRQVANERNLAFDISMGDALPSLIRTDMKRLRQILQNLLSNAFKFTLQGRVYFDMSVAHGGWRPGLGSLDEAGKVIAFSVSDSGIGIAEDKQRIIFEAFRQADGTTSRQFEGTGLGLSISAELARLLGGEITVHSTPGMGSRFTLYLPDVFRRIDDTIAESAPPETEPTFAADARIPNRITARVLANVDQIDDRENIRPADRVVLIVMEEKLFADKLLHQVRELGFRGLSAPNAHTALAMANEYMPNIVIVEITPTDMSGWATRNLLKRDPDTRHIPVNMIALDGRQDGYASMCAFGMVHKPSNRETLQEALVQVRGFMGRELRNVLVAAGGKAQRDSMVEAIAMEQMRIHSASTSKQALKLLRKLKPDCAVIGESLADMSGFIQDFVQTGIEETYIVICTTVYSDDAAGQGSSEQIAEIFRLKCERSAGAALGQTARCLQQALKEMPPGHRRPVPSMRLTVPALEGKKVLVVDDDVRNIFALTGALEQQGMQVLNAESGRNGIELLKSNPDVNVILMDIMMPEQDGYETIRAIRGLNGANAIPIIGVTAKAMVGDRERCIEAGATDYIAKPINIEQLLSLLRMWIVDQTALA
jgi:signal transduction histidine kinase/PleD family two-component response regulator